MQALAKLATEKGYDLVGCDSQGVNAFFVKSELIKDTKLKKVSANEAYYPICKRSFLTLEDQRRELLGLDFDDF